MKESLQPFDILAKRAVERANDKAFAYLRLGDQVYEEFQYLTWSQVFGRLRKYGEIIRSFSDLKRGDRVVIYGPNTPEWVIADFAALAAGFVTVPLSTQATEEEFEFCLTDANVKLIITAQKIEFLRGDLANIPQLTFVDLEKGCQTVEGNFAPSPLDPDEMNTLIYTSGTSGLPKGVMHSLRSFLLAYHAIKPIFSIKPKDVLLSYLPLSHVAERMLVEFGSLFSGCTVYFIDQVEKLSLNLPKVRPTIFLAVPRIWDLLRFRIERELHHNVQLQERLNAIPGFLRNFIISKFLKKKIGLDRGRILLSGAAKLNLESAEFLNRFGIKILEGYGLTETLCIATFSGPSKNRFGSVGQTCPGVTLKMAADGEICLRADFLFLGYYHRDDETSEAMQGGWFHTGDVGKMDTDGYLKITDRKKNIFKTSNGKYVAPLPIEIELKNHPGVFDAIVIGDDRPHCVALLSVDENKIDEKSLKVLLDRVNARLAPHEQLKSIGYMTHRWSIETGELTASLKSKRKVILEKYAAQIEDLYESRQRIKLVDTAQITASKRVGER